jgi:hypothetical protein
VRSSSCFTNPEDRAFLLHDLSERFLHEAESRGLRTARRWYWAQALRVVPWALRPDGGLLWRRSWVGLLGDVRVMGLVAARRIETRRDRSIRLALGASERRLLRGSLTESVLLAGFGTLLGALGADWLIGPIRSMIPADVPRLADVRISMQLVIAGLALGTAVGGVIGLGIPEALRARGITAAMASTRRWPATTCPSWA